MEQHVLFPNTHISSVDWDALVHASSYDNATQAQDIDNDNVPDAWTLVQSKEDILNSQATNYCYSSNI